MGTRAAEVPGERSPRQAQQRRARVVGGGALAAAVIAAILAAAVLAACGPAPSASPPSAAPVDRAVVTLGIYSGRPDPSWELVGTQATILVRMLADLPVEQGVPPQGGLGYRGFTVDIMTGGQVERLVVYRGAVAAEGSGARPVRLDPTRSVERYLLQSGRSQLDPAEAAAVEADLGGA